jgi:hypothetical protein
MVGEFGEWKGTEDLQTSPTFVMQSCMTVGDFESCLFEGVAVSFSQKVADTAVDSGIN